MDGQLDWVAHVRRVIMKDQFLFLEVKGTHSWMHTSVDMVYSACKKPRGSIHSIEWICTRLRSIGQNPAQAQRNCTPNTCSDIRGRSSKPLLQLNLCGTRPILTPRCIQLRSVHIFYPGTVAYMQELPSRQGCGTQDRARLLATSQ